MLFILELRSNFGGWILFILCTTQYFRGVDTIYTRTTQYFRGSILKGTGAYKVKIGPWPKKGTPQWFRGKKGHTGNDILVREKSS